MNTPALHSIEMNWTLPWWVTSGLLLLVLFYCGWCYRIEYRRWLDWNANQSHLRSRWLWPLIFSGIRATTCGLLLWMMAEWSWQPFIQQPPQLFVVLDSSESMGTHDGEYDSAESRYTRVLEWMKDPVWNPLRTKFDLHLFHVNESLEGIDDWPDSIPPASSASQRSGQVVAKGSALGDGLLQALRVAQGNRVAGILLLSDGVITEGVSLLDAASTAAEQEVPLYMVGVGQRPLQPDLAVREANLEPNVFLGDMLLIETFLTRQDTLQPSSLVSLKDADTGSLLDEQTAYFLDGQLETSLQLRCQTSSTSLKRLSIEIAPLESEKDRSNNQMIKNIEVRDAPISVLLVDGHPSYEFRFLKHLLERSRQPAAPDRPAFALMSVLGDADLEYTKQDQSARATIPVENESLQKFDAIVLGDVPTGMLTSTTLQQSLVRYVSESGGGLMVVAGPDHMPIDYIGSPLAQLMPIQLDRLLAMSDPLPFHWQLTPTGDRTMALRLEPTFEESLNVWSRLPVQRWRWAGIQPTPLAQVLATTGEPNGPREPLLITQYVGAGRVAFQATNETFQWQTHQGDDLYYQRYWIQLMRWLSRNRSLQSGAGNQIQLNGKRFEPQDTIRAWIHLQPDHPAAENNSLAISLIGSKGEDESLPQNLIAYRVPGASNEFACELPPLAPDEYRLVVQHSDVEMSSDLFVVLDTTPELRRLTPDEATMRQAAELSGGEFAHLSHALDVTSWIKPMESEKRQPLPKIPIWNQPWVWVLMLGLLTIEWLLRRSIGLP